MHDSVITGIESIDNQIAYKTQNTYTIQDSAAIQSDPNRSSYTMI